MWALGIDTSGEVFRGAIIDLRETSWHYLARCDRVLGRETSALAHPELQELWQGAGEPPWETLAWVAVAIGPGSFTGTRVGVVTARILGQQWNVPVFAIAQTDWSAAKDWPLMAKAWERWQQGDRPSWETVYPLYSNPSDPGQG